MHVQATRRFRDVAVELLEDTLDMFPTDAIGGHRVLRRRRQRPVAGIERRWISSALAGLAR